MLNSAGPGVLWSRRRLVRVLAVTPVLRWLAVRFSAPGDSSPAVCPACTSQPDLLSSAAMPAGRCECGRHVGPPLLSVEAATAACAVALAATPLSMWERVAYGWWAACAVVLALTDLVVHRLPRPLAFAATAGLLLALGPSALSGQETAWVRSAEAALVVAAALALLALLPSGLGGGDVTAGLAVGAAAGWISWFAVVAALFAGFVLVAVHAVVLMVAGRATRRTPIPLGPALLTGTLLVVVLLRAFGS